MDKNHTSARQRRYQAKKKSFLVRILIAVVALIECLILIVFTTYSWIESSSSLIISSGKNGVLSMSVANNLNYQVLVSNDAAGNVNLMANKYNELMDDGGYYRTVQYFSYAKTSSADGKTFYFRKTNGDNTNPYRLGDTADYNTSYTYLDFELKNTTKTTKAFYFSNENIFVLKDGENELSYNSMSEPQQKIVNAMRISIQKNNSTPDIYSWHGGNSTAITSTDGAYTSVTSRSIVGSHYIYTGEAVDEPVFQSTNNNAAESVEDKISIRIWFDVTDDAFNTYRNGLADKDSFDAMVSAAQIKINFSFINDNVDYDQIYFDDYAFSQKSDALGSFVTEEDNNYSMFLHAYNSKQNAYVNYPMSKVVNNDNPAVRWMASIPIPQVIEERDSNGSVLHRYLSDTSSTQFQNAYFFYGTATSGTAAPTKVMYKWSLPGAINIGTPSDAHRSSSNSYVIYDSSRYFRNLGVVRNATTKASTGVDNYVQGTSTEPINGFIQFEADASGAMTLAYVRDRATGLTTRDYNLMGTGEYNYKYITNSISDIELISSGGSTPAPVSGPDYSAIPLSEKEKIFYFDIPASYASGSKLIFMDRTDSDGGNSQYRTNQASVGADNQTPLAVYDGVCYTLDMSNYQYYTDQYAVPYTPSAYSIPALNDGTNIRVYFYRSDAVAEKWTSGSIYLTVNNVGAYSVEKSSTTKVSEASGGSGGGGSTPSEESFMIRSDNLYLNRKNNNAVETASNKTISMYCTDLVSGVYKAYVPSAWLTDTFDIHYTKMSGGYGYYDSTNDAIRWATPSASMTDGDYVFTVLGYSDSVAVGSLSAATGIGTWSAVREMTFDTELIDGNIAAAFRYKASITAGSTNIAGDYPMVPADNLCLKFMAYVPVDGLSTQSSTPVLSFKQFSAYSSSTTRGQWTPDEDITSTELIYYAVDVEGDDNSDQGWYHVAVLTDATFENLIEDTIVTDPVSGASLTYSYDDEHYYSIPVHIGNLYWVVPMVDGNTIYDAVYFKWIPYPATNTEFVYTHYISDGIYCVVTEMS